MRLHTKSRVDYFEPLSNVVRFDTVRLMLIIALSNDMHIRQLDITGAFLYGTLEDIYMVPPYGLV